jgi:hypothetical protein
MAGVEAAVEAAGMGGKVLVMAAGAAALAAVIAGCALGPSTAGGRYIDQMTCEIKNPNAGDPKYDPQCILAAQQSAKAAARAAAKEAAAKGKK